MRVGVTPSERQLQQRSQTPNFMCQTPTLHAKHLAKHPTYCAEHPTYCAKHPTFRAKHPTCRSPTPEILEQSLDILGHAPSTGGQWVCTFNGYEDLEPRTEPRTGSRTDPKTGSRMENLTFRTGFSFVHFRPFLDPEMAGKWQSVRRKKLIFSTF